MKILRVIALALIISISALAVYSAARYSAESRLIEKDGLYMGTIVRIKIPVHPQKEKVKIGKAIRKAFEEIARVENMFSVFKEESEISKINRLKAGEKLKLNSEVFGLIERSISYSRRTEGAFDITVKPLGDLWKAARANGRLPSDESLKAALSKVGFKYISLDKKDGTIALAREGMAIDAGGIAKGYAVDRAVNILKENGIRNALVDAGGDVYCLGMRSRGKMWKIGIQHPRKSPGMISEIKLKNKAVDTSGDYEKYFILNGRRYSHIIDPRSGYPIGDNVVSATVIAEDSTTADMLATALCVLGKSGFKAIITEGAEAMIVINENGRLKTEATAGFDS